MNKQKWGRRSAYCVVGVMTAVALAVYIERAWLDNQEAALRAGGETRPHTSWTEAYAAPSTALPKREESLEELATRDPLGFFEAGISRYDRSIRDYTCTFIKQEMLGGKLASEQTIGVEFRENPYSVRMKWLKNPDKCTRVLYVADRWVQDDASMALIEPRAIARLFVPYVLRPIQGEEAKRSSRKTIDQFGFRNSMVLASKFVKLARERKVEHSFKYVGKGKLDGRDTFMFERHLPYTGEDGDWPDRALTVQIDQQWQVPLLCKSFANDAMTELLASYRMSEVKLNPSLPDSTFTKEGMGL